MPIEYSCIAKRTNILCSHQAGPGNFEDVAKSMLQNIPTYDTKTTYASSMHMFHVQVENGVTYLCASNAEFSKRLTFGYLGEIKNRFTSSSLGVRASMAGEKEFDRDFAHIMSSQMKRYSKGEDSMSTLQSQVDDVKDVMTQNIEKVLERGERLEDLLSKSTDLEASGLSFKTTARRVQRKMWWNNMKMKICLGVGCFVLILVVVLIILFSLKVLPVKSVPAPTKAALTTTSKP